MQPAQPACLPVQINIGALVRHPYWFCRLIVITRVCWLVLSCLCSCKVFWSLILHRSGDQQRLIHHVQLRATERSTRRPQLLGRCSVSALIGTVHACLRCRDRCLPTQIASLLVVNVQTKVSWAWGYAVPTIAFGLALAIFLLGTRLYKFVPPGGSALTRIGQVCL